MFTDIIIYSWSTLLATYHRLLRRQKSRRQNLGLLSAKFQKYFAHAISYQEFKDKNAKSVDLDEVAFPNLTLEVHKKQTTNLTSAKFQKCFVQIYHTENSQTRGQMIRQLIMSNLI